MTTERTAEPDDGRCEPVRPCPVDPRVERTHAAVGDAAAALLLGGGPDAITHQQVAQAAGVSRTTVYKHWPDRSDLLRAAVEAVDTAIREAPPVHDNVRDDLRHLLGLLTRDLSDDVRATLTATLIERSQHDPTVAGVRDSMVAHISGAFGELIRRAIERGELDVRVDPDRSLASLAGALIFTRLLAGRPVDDTFVEALIDDFVVANRPR